MNATITQGREACCAKPLSGFQSEVHKPTSPERVHLARCLLPTDCAALPSCFLPDNDDWNSKVLTAGRVCSRGKSRAAQQTAALPLHYLGKVLSKRVHQILKAHLANFGMRMCTHACACTSSPPQQPGVWTAALPTSQCCVCCCQSCCDCSANRDKARSLANKPNTG